jgi:hypothetical protein
LKALYNIGKTFFYFFRADNEIAYRQELEIKYKELNDYTLFEKKLYEQELENLKSQLNIAQAALKDSGSFF